MASSGNNRLVVKCTSEISMDYADVTTTELGTHVKEISSLNIRHMFHPEDPEFVGIIRS